MDKIKSRKRRATKTRAHIMYKLNVPRLCVHRTPKHIYAQVIVFNDGQSKVVASASTLDGELRKELQGDKTARAKTVGQCVAKRAIEAGYNKLAFDRSGFKYHGRVKALADAAREAGIDF